MAERTIPWALLIGGVVIDLAGTGMVITALRRQRRGAGPTPPTEDATVVDEPAAEVETGGPPAGRSTPLE